MPVRLPRRDLRVRVPAAERAGSHAVLARRHDLAHPRGAGLLIGTVLHSTTVPDTYCTVTTICLALSTTDRHSTTALLQACAGCSQSNTVLLNRESSRPECEDRTGRWQCMQDTYECCSVHTVQCRTIRYYIPHHVILYCALLCCTVL